MSDSWNMMLGLTGGLYYESSEESSSLPSESDLGQNDQQEMPPTEVVPVETMAEDQKHALLLGFIIAVSIFYTWEETPDGLLLSTFLKYKVPAARPQMTAHDTRCLQRAHWASFAMWDRAQRMQNGEIIGPPCGTCGVMCWSKCSGCKITPLCPRCEQQLPCHTCLFLMSKGNPANDPDVEQRQKRTMPCGH